MTTTIPDERIHEIERRLADLGPLDGWGSTIDPETGDLLLQVPRHFLWENDAIWLGNMEGSSQADHALLDWIGDAPFAIRDLLALTNRYRAALEQVVSACEICDGGIVEYTPPGLDAWLPTGDPNIQDQPCPNCGPARAALGLTEEVTQ